MLETLSVRPRICDQIRSGPLGRWVDDFVDVLMTRGYATGTVRRYVRAAAIFSAWLDQQRVAATDVDETLVTRFVTGLSRRPSSTRPSGRLSDVAYGVRLVAAHLWTRGVAARPVRVAALCESEQWLQRFDEHLVQAHGLVVGTRRRYRRYAAAFLAECAGTPTPDWSRLTVPTEEAQRAQQTAAPPAKPPAPQDRKPQRKGPRGNGRAATVAPQRFNEGAAAHQAHPSRHPTRTSSWAPRTTVPPAKPSARSHTSTRRPTARADWSCTVLTRWARTPAQPGRRRTRRLRGAVRDPALASCRPAPAVRIPTLLGPCGA